jgi:chemotaxis protein methyltransferase WspC
MPPSAWMTDVETILAEAIGMDAASIGEAALHESIRSAYRGSGIADPAEFVAAVREDEERLRDLVACVVVPETWFFRDEAPFEFVRRHAVAWTLAHPGRVLRVLSAPCATGEEPYSIAMTLLAAGLTPDHFVIDAVDVSGPLLERARRGIYQEAALRKCPDAMRRRYFCASSNGFVVDDVVRTCVSFTRGNLLDAVVTLPSAPYDVVFCRNLLIYLHQPARRLLRRLLAGILAADGILMVGHAEALAVCEGDTFAIADSRAFALTRTPKAAPAGTPDR